MSRAPHTPSPGQIHRALTELQQAKEALQQIDPAIAEDAKLLLDSLEGMTDAVEVIDRLIEASIQDDVLAKATRAHAAAVAERAARIERRRNALRSMVLTAMQTMEQPRLERPGFTVSLRQNAAELIIDEAALPDDYFRVKREPDRILIRKHLDTNVTVPGAMLGNAAQSIMVKV